jgi:hypothetical protein
MADALATVAERAGDEAHWDRALDKLFLTLAALDDDKVVGFLRGGLDGSAPGGAGDDFVRALALCVTLADRRTDPTPFLQRVFRSSEGLALGEKLAGELCDPAPVLGGDDGRLRRPGALGARRGTAGVFRPGAPRRKGERGAVL